MVARPGLRDHIQGMSQRPRNFSQTKVRDASGQASAARWERGLQAPVAPVEVAAKLDPRASAENLPKELGGPKGPEPTRFGDWEHNGRCSDF